MSHYFGGSKGEVFELFDAVLLKERMKGRTAIQDGSFRTSTEGSMGGCWLDVATRGFEILGISFGVVGYSPRQSPSSEDVEQRYRVQIISPRSLRQVKNPDRRAYFILVFAIGLPLHRRAVCGAEFILGVKRTIFAYAACDYS
jgi:hypothetical protein